MHKGLMSSLSLYLVKHLNELFAPYGSFFETNILSTSIAFILTASTFFYFFIVEIYVAPTHSYTGWKRNVNILK